MTSGSERPIRGRGALQGISAPAVVERLSTLRDEPYVVLRAEHSHLATSLRPEDWDHLDRQLERLPWEGQARGDIADHSLDVSMLVTNCPRPAPVDGAAAVLLEFLLGTGLLQLLHSVLGRPTTLHLRRAQVNRMTTGSYNQFHRDTDDDPDYVLGALLYPSDPGDHDGGEIWFEGARLPFKPPRRSLVVFRADLGHGLRPLVRCRSPRLSVVLLFGEHSASNRRFATKG